MNNRDREFRDILIPAHSCDSLLIILTAPDSIGYFSKNIHIKVNTEIYLKPIELFATVIESFENQDIEKNLQHLRSSTIYFVLTRYLKKIKLKHRFR